MRDMLSLKLSACAAKDVVCESKAQNLLSGGEHNLVYLNTTLLNNSKIPAIGQNYFVIQNNCLLRYLDITNNTFYRLI